MAIHIDIYAHLVKNKMVREGEELKRYVEKLESDLNARWEKGAVGRSAKIVKANDAQAASVQRLRQQIVNTTAVLDDEESSTESQTRAMEALSNAVRTATRDKKALDNENAAFVKRQRQVNGLVSVNENRFLDLTVATNKQRRELEGLRKANAAIVKDHAALVRQLDAVYKATKKTIKERKNYDRMVEEDIATSKQYRDASDRVIAAHEDEQKLLAGTKTALDDLIRSRGQHDVVVKANSYSLRDFSRTALDSRKQMEALRATHLGVIRNNAALSRSFDAISDSTDMAFRQHQKYNKMARDSSVSQDELRRQLDRTNDAYARQTKDVDNATEGLRRHQSQQAVAAANRRTGAGGGGGRGGGGGPGGHMRFDPGRWAARNLGALTPLGMVTPTLVLPLGTAFFQVANAAVAASQSIALLPAVMTAAGAGIGTLQMATAGFGDTVGALMEGDLEKFAKTIQKLSPAAQQAALTLQYLGPELKGMQQATEEAFFTGAPQMIFGLTKGLGPMVQEMTTGIATSMNHAMMGVGDMLLAPEGMADVETITQNITESFQTLEPAVSAVAHAFLDLTEVGSDFLPIMGKDLAEVAESFRKFISEARDSGALREFMFQGWEAIKAVGGALTGFGKMLYDVFGLKSQEDVQKFRDSMQEMTDLVETVLRTLKKVFEDLASLFSWLSEKLNLFGIDLDGLSGVLASLAEAWLFLHGVKWTMDFLGGIKLIKAAMVGLPIVGGTGGGAASRVAGVVGGLATAGGAAAVDAGAAATGGIAAAFGGLLGPIAIATTAIAGLGAAAIYATHKLSETDFQESTTPTLPNGQPRPGLLPGTGGIPFPELSESDRARLTVMKGPDFNPHSIPIEELYKLLGKPVPPPSAPLQHPSEGGFFDPNARGWWGNVPNFPVPAEPTKPGDFQSTPGTFEMSNIPIGQFGGAQWNVPPGLMDLPPDYQNLGKTGFYRPDQYKIFQEQNQADEARTRVEEARIAYLAKQAETNHTQDEINKAAHNVIEAEQDWLNAQRQLKEAERGEFTDLTSQTNSFADDLRDSLGDLGAALDPDLGISKGLAGLAENLVKFVATLAAAPVLGAMKGTQAGLGFPGNKGVGSGLIGMIAAGRGYYENPNALSPEDQAQLQLGERYGIVNPTLNGPVPAQVPGRPGVAPTANRPGAGSAANLPTGPVPAGGVAAQIIALAQRSSGGRYAAASDLAGGLSDCSGAVSDLVEIIKKGRADSSRISDFVAGPNTRETLTNLGAVEGAIPGALQVGWGSQGGWHMRATLPNGVPFESGGGTGQGATYGGAAKGAQGMPNIMSFVMPAPAVAPGAPPVATGPPAAAPVPPGIGGAPPAPGLYNVPAGQYDPHPRLTRDPATGAYFARGGWVGFDEGGNVGFDDHGNTVGGPYGAFAMPGAGWNTPMSPKFNSGVKLDTSTFSTSGPSYWSKYARDILPPSIVPGPGGHSIHRHPALNYLSGWPDYNADMTLDRIIQANTGQGGWDKPPAWPPQRYARGGSTDTVPAMLTPGEFVVNDRASQKFGPLLEHINGYDGGGKVPPDPGFIIPPGIGELSKPSSGKNPLDVFGPVPKSWEYPNPLDEFKPPPVPGVPPPPGVVPPEGVPHLPDGTPHLTPGPPGQPPLPGPPAPVGVPTEGSHVGSQVEPYAGYGPGFSISGGILGAALGAAGSAAGMGMSALSGGSDGGAGGAAASAAIQIGIQELTRGIEFGAEAAGIGVQGVLDTILPTGGSQLAQENWLTRFMGGIVGAAPALPNLAGGLASDQLGRGANLPGVGPATPEQIAARSMNPLRSEHTGTGPAPGPNVTNGIGHVENLIMQGPEDRLGQDIARYQPAPGAR